VLEQVLKVELFLSKTQIKMN